MSDQKELIARGLLIRPYVKTLIRKNQIIKLSTEMFMMEAEMREEIEGRLKTVR